MLYERVVEYITRNEISIREFERMCGLSNGTVHGWKMGNIPSTASVRKIVDATHISADRWI